jgi:16S rRNA (adenine1518-N6/adenine1519-N6)-dimethyltransferase
VGSAVIRLTTHKEPPVTVQDEKLMFAIIRASFNQRRKTLQNGLSHVAELGIPKELTVKILEEMELSPTIRGEAMTLQQFAEFTNRVMQSRTA